MPRPKLKIRKVLPQDFQDGPVAFPIDEASLIPDGWQHGQLLNVRNAGAVYVVTLLGEEFDYRHPERAMQFSNPAQCQDFISKWYARQHHDPRAL